MSGGKQKRPLGYTIVEVMIVLAVSGVMFLIAASFLQGKQEKSSFVSGVNGMASRLQDIIEQINDGKYSDLAINCSSGPTFAAAGGPSGVSQGTNTACVFLGKVLHFSPSGNPNQYEVFTIVGNRVDSVTGKVALTLSAANPTPVYAPVDLTTQDQIPQNLNAKVYTGSSGAAGGQIYAFGFLQGLGTDNGAGDADSGSQPITLYYSGGLTNAMNEATAAGAIKNNFLALSSVSVCLTDGTQTAKLVVGGNGSQLTVDTQFEGRTAICV